MGHPHLRVYARLLFLLLLLFVTIFMIDASSGFAGPGAPPTPAVISASDGGSITSILAGFEHTCVFNAANGVYCWGENNRGRFGDGVFSDNYWAPTRIDPISTGFLTINNGYEHTCGITSGQGMKCWGRNEDGQIGADKPLSDTIYDPADVVGLSSGVQEIALGSHHSCALVNGGVKCWGWNAYGQVGIGSDGGSNPAPKDVSGLISGVSSFDVGAIHGCAVINGGVQCWGYGKNGELGNGSRENSNVPVDVTGLASGVKSVALGDDHSCALMQDGTVKCWGDGNDGQLGTGSTFDRSTPADVVGLDGPVSQLAAHGEHTCALLTNGSVQCWGDNGGGQIGDGTLDDRSRPTPVQNLANVQAITVGNRHTCALLENGRGACWGVNISGQLSDGVREHRSVPDKLVGGAATAGKRGPSSLQSAQIGGGEGHTCIRTVGGGVQCWGSNFYGQLGDGSFQTQVQPVPVQGLQTSVDQLAVGGNNFTCARVDGAAKCWGRDNVGQVGDGSNFSTDPVKDVEGIQTGATDISAGSNHACVVIAGGVKCWGYNGDGQVGDGSRETQRSPVDVPGLTGVQQVAAGGNFTCALLAAGTVQCWGDNSGGQLGNGETSDSMVPVDVSGLGGVQSLVVGFNHACVLLAGGTVQCWGENRDGALGDGSTDDRSTPVNVVGLAGPAQSLVAGFGYTCALLTNGTVQCWGSNSWGVLGDGSDTRQTSPVNVSNLTGVTGIGGGSGHVCAQLAEGIRCWGNNQSGQLGNGEITYRTVPGALVDWPVSGKIDETGGTVSGYGLTLTFPASAFAQSTTVTGTAQAIFRSPDLPAGMQAVGPAFLITAEEASKSRNSYDQRERGRISVVVFTPDRTSARVQPAATYTLENWYSDGELAGAPEESLALFRWDGGQWQKADSTVNVETNRISVVTSELGLWAVLGAEKPAGQAGNTIYLPALGR